MKSAIIVIAALALTPLAQSADACGFAREHVTATLDATDLRRALQAGDALATNVHLNYPKFELTGDYLYAVDLRVRSASLAPLLHALADARRASATVELVEVKHREWRLVSWTLQP